MPVITRAVESISPSPCPTPNMRRALASESVACISGCLSTDCFSGPCSKPANPSFFKCCVSSGIAGATYASAVLLRMLFDLLGMTSLAPQRSRQ